MIVIDVETEIDDNRKVSPNIVRRGEGLLSHTRKHDSDRFATIMRERGECEVPHNGGYGTRVNSSELSPLSQPGDLHSSL